MITEKGKSISEIMAEKAEKGILTDRASAVKKIVNEESKNKFLQPDFSKEIKKQFNLKLSPYQDDLLTQLAYKRRSSKQQVIVEAIFEMLEKEDLFHQLDA